MSRILDASIGRIIRWVAQQWDRGRGRDDRRRAVFNEISAAMADAVAAAEKLGVGLLPEAPAIQAGVRSELRVGELSQQVTDPELVEIIGTFRERAAVIFGRGQRVKSWADSRSELRDAFDRATTRMRQLQSSE
jgi:hypothetical protein